MSSFPPVLVWSIFDERLLCPGSHCWDLEGLVSADLVSTLRVILRSPIMMTRWWQDDDGVLPRILTLASQFSEAVFRSRTFLFKADNHNWRTFTWLSLLPSIAASFSVQHWFKYWPLEDVNIQGIRLFVFLWEGGTFLCKCQGLVLVSCVLPSCCQEAGGCSTIAISRTLWLASTRPRGWRLSCDPQPLLMSLLSNLLASPSLLGRTREKKDQNWAQDYLEDPYLSSPVLYSDNQICNISFSLSI